MVSARKYHGQHQINSNAEDIAKYHRALQQRGMSKRTASNRHANLKAFLLHLGFKTKDLPRPPKFDKTLPEIYTDSE